jgi:hypothetical protein
MVHLTTIEALFDDACSEHSVWRSAYCIIVDPADVLGRIAATLTHGPLAAIPGPSTAW